MSNIFPKSANALPLQIVIYLFVFGGVVTAAVTYYGTNKYANVGYQPVQPVRYEHSLHAGQLGLDCRYCHSNVEKSGWVNIPSSQTCMNCHSIVKRDSPLLAPIRASYESGEPVQWVQVHKAPDYVYFNHAVHVNRGVSCYECHGKINEMKVVFQDKSQTMGWCLECHRNPAMRLRPPSEVFNLDWVHPAEDEQLKMGSKFVHDWKVKPPQSCSGCHR